MRKVILGLLLVFSSLLTIYAAPPDENYTMGQNGRLLFQYPKSWVGGIIEDEGLMGLANSKETLEVVFDGGTPQPGQAAVAIFNETYLINEYEVDPTTATLEEVATILSQDNEDFTYTTIGESEVEGKPVFRMDGESAEGSTLILLVVDTGEGIAGLGLVAATSQIREYELIVETIAGSMDYLSQDEIGFEGDAQPTLTYLSLNDKSLTFQYPEGAIITEALGVVIVSNQENALDVDNLQSGDVLIAFFSPALFESELSEEQLDMTSAELMEFLRSDLAENEATQTSEVHEMTLGDRTLLRTDIVDSSDNFDAILLTMDTETGALAAMLVTSVGEREQYEVLFFSMVESLDYQKIEE